LRRLLHLNLDAQTLDKPRHANVPLAKVNVGPPVIGRDESINITPLVAEDPFDAPLHDDGLIWPFMRKLVAQFQETAVSRRDGQ